ncbi:hypothetical protein AB4097_08605 [Microvirga sp. 2MCAF35]|uniref:hypothetical protein n=1 Tax=Microvirga sp. 2MCAF35 TaxID=3232987 RepID=UPI003F988A66
MAFTIFQAGGIETMSTRTDTVVFDQHVTSLADHGWLVTWVELNSAGTETTLYQRRFAADGSSGMDVPVEAANPSYFDGSSVQALPGGGWVVTWVARSSTFQNLGLFQRVYDKDGETTGPDVPVSALYSQHPSTTVLSDGGWVVTWEGSDETSTHIYQRRYDRFGAQVGVDLRLDDTGIQQSEPMVTALDDGGWIVAWRTQQDGAGDRDIVSKRFDANGQGGPEVFITAAAGSDERPSEIITLEDDSWVMVWQADGGIFQRHGETGTIVRVNADIGNTHGDASATALKTGGWVVTWNSGSGIVLRAYDAQGNATTVENVPLGATDGSEPAVEALDDGGWVVTWKDGFHRISQRQFAPDGATMLGSSVDIAIGTDDNDTLLAASNGLNAGDILRGGAGTDTLELSGAGTLDLTVAATISGIERILGSAGNDRIVLNLERWASFNTIDGGGGNDVLELSGGEGSDPRFRLNGSITGFEKLLFTNATRSIIEIVSRDTGLLVHAQGIDDLLLNNSGTAFTVQERAQLFRQGVESIRDANGATYTNATPTIIALDGDATSFSEGGTAILIDAGSNADFGDDNGLPGSITVEITGHAKAGEDVLGIKANANLVLSDGANAGSTLTYQGEVVGIVAQGSTATRLKIDLTETALPSIKFILQALTYRNTNEFDPATDTRTIAVTVTDGGGRFTVAHTTVAIVSDNDMPTVTVPGGIETTLDTGQIMPFAGLTIGDDSASVTVVITPDASGKGHFTQIGAGVLNPATGALTFTGPVQAVMAAIRGVIFEPRDRLDAAGMAEDTTFSIAVSDGALSAPAAAVTIKSIAANREPTGITLDRATVQELAGPGIVGTFATSDPNAGETFTYRLLDDAGGRFVIVNGQLMVGNGVALDYEQAQSHRITVRSTDRSGVSIDRFFDIAVTNVSPERTEGSSGDDRVIGDNGRDTLKGGAGDDWIAGGLGADILTGGAGKDKFVFDTRLQKSNVDVMSDFSKGDKIYLDDSIFRKVGKGSPESVGKLSSKAFWMGGKAHDASDRIIYDPKGILYYDPDGTGGAAQVKFATLPKKLKLTAQDFLII